MSLRYLSVSHCKIFREFKSIQSVKVIFCLCISRKMSVFFQNINDEMSPLQKKLYAQFMTQEKRGCFEVYQPSKLLRLWDLQSVSVSMDAYSRIPHFEFRISAWRLILGDWRFGTIQKPCDCPSGHCCISFAFRTQRIRLYQFLSGQNLAEWTVSLSNSSISAPIVEFRLLFAPVSRYRCDETRWW